MLHECLQALAEMSNKYGANPEYVLAGGGNTSFKTDEFLFIKGSGTALATIKPDEFVKMERSLLYEIRTKKYSNAEDECEAEVLSDMMNARAKSQNGRPSVETVLHDLFEQKYVLHLHPAKVNGITCAKNGRETAEKLFPNAVWIENSKPGYTLAMTCLKEIENAKAKSGKCPNMILLENHGIFFAGDTTNEIDELVKNTMEAINNEIKREPDLNPTEFDIDKAAEISPVLRMLTGDGQPASVIFESSKAILDYDPNTGSFSPDHIVYCKASPLILCDGDNIKQKYNEYVEQNSCKPKIAYYRDLGIFAMADTMKNAITAKDVFLDAIKISVYSESFGGASSMPKWLEKFILNWEVESYRAKVSLAAGTKKRLENKVILITGAAQGFGRGIAEELARDGAYVAIADMNYEGATALSETIPFSMAVKVNVADEASVADMIKQVTLRYGGLDVLISNAGIVKAGSLAEMEKAPFELVCSVNYTGYFLCAKYASKVMKQQNEIIPSYISDIIQINSKSGLEGSNKNFAYAGSKFGGIGLTESFALELAPFNIKVNAICPGNFLNGPLWSDPEKGLFVQYLNAGKVPGAKTVEDVRKFYESKVPLGRGCEIKDVTRAINYIIEQEYETGQAIPVTGGQTMLH